MAGWGRESADAGTLPGGLDRWGPSCRWGAVTGGDGRGCGGGQPGLPRCAGYLPGDMMMDWVSARLRGDAAAQSLEAVRVPCSAGQVAELTAQWRELAAVVPHRVSAAPAA